ncbi:hypothetical protein RRG08_051744 [Elysia crispata]|uniref:Uncharacterized protein n=1 Tax=Elysia crispata TaxID=231223 RepID=A0AAE1BBW2_9GAST|nr:hypothetical protein RRG08_051744 [Elysia crispata]
MLNIIPELEQRLSLDTNCRKSEATILSLGRQWSSRWHPPQGLLRRAGTPADFTWLYLTASGAHLEVTLTEVGESDLDTTLCSPHRSDSRAVLTWLCVIGLFFRPTRLTCWNFRERISELLLSCEVYFPNASNDENVDKMAALSIGRNAGSKCGRKSHE